MAKLAAKAYGAALFELAVEENKVDLLFEEVKCVAELLEENKELSKIMKHPKIMKEEKLQITEDIFKGRVSNEVVGLFKTVVTKDRYEEISEILNYFISEVKEFKNIGVVRVESAVPLSKKQKEQVEDRLKKTTRYTQVEMHYHVCPELIGGMKIRIGDRVIDSSIQTKLEYLKKDLLKIQLA